MCTAAPVTRRPRWSAASATRLARPSAARWRRGPTRLLGRRAPARPLAARRAREQPSPPTPAARLRSTVAPRMRKWRWVAMAIKPLHRTALLAVGIAALAVATPAAAQVTVASGVHAGELDVPVNKSQVLRVDRPY